MDLKRATFYIFYKLETKEIYLINYNLDQEEMVRIIVYTN